MVSVSGLVGGISCVRFGRGAGRDTTCHSRSRPQTAQKQGPTILKTSYLAIPVEQVTRLMRTVGFENVGRVDGRFFQPVLVGTRPVV